MNAPVSLPGEKEKTMTTATDNQQPATSGQVPPVVQVTTRWFMSYVKVTRVGGCSMQFGSNVMDRVEHPVATVLRWNREYGRQEGCDIILLSFQEVGRDVPEMDVATNYIT